MPGKTLILRRFSAVRDFRSVQWSETIRYNLLRSACAGVVLSVLFMLVGGPSPGSPGPNPFVALLMPVGYVMGYLPVGLLLNKLGGIFAPLYLVAMAMAIISVSLGDPLVFTLRRLVPGIVPVETPPFFSLSLIIYILKPEYAEELTF